VKGDLRFFFMKSVVLCYQASKTGLAGKTN
jgi:hypothetical protein